MANQLLDIMPRILSSALITLRENAIMPKLVNSSYSADAAQKGNVIQVPVPTAVPSQDVLPGAYSQTVNDLTLNTVPVPLNNWREAPFYFSDKDNAEMMDGVVPMQLLEAAKSLGNDIDRSLLGLYKQAYNYYGVAGTTPIGSTSDIIQCRGILNKTLAPLSDRRFVLNPDAESNALSLSAFQLYLNSGTTQTMNEGELGRKFGFDFYMDQNVITHTAGTLAGTIVTSAIPTSVSTPDSSSPQLHNARTTNSVGISGATTGTTIGVGDVFTVAGDTQTYVVTNNSIVAGGIATIAFSPAPKVLWASGSTLTLKASRVANLAFHRDAFALAIRPIESASVEGELGGKSLTMVDPITGIPLRLQVRLEFNRVRYALDCLWGAALVRPEHVVVLAG